LKGLIVLPEEVRKGIDLFNRGEFFAAHEVLENAWRAEKGPIRSLYQGILQIVVGCYHIQRNNYLGPIIY
jgi:predicted metal-dependent hydrolase